MTNRKLGVIPFLERLPKLLPFHKQACSERPLDGLPKRRAWADDTSLRRVLAEHPHAKYSGLLGHPLEPGDQSYPHGGPPLSDP